MLHYLKSSTFFLGLDVAHPVGEEARRRGDVRDKGGKPSIAAIVGNEDTDCCVWMPTMKIQKRRREHIVYLQDAVEERLLAYFKKTCTS